MRIPKRNVAKTTEGRRPMLIIERIERIETEERHTTFERRRRRCESDIRTLKRGWQ